MKTVTLTLKLELETNEDNKHWPDSDLEQWAMAHLQNLAYEAFDVEAKVNNN